MSDGDQGALNKLSHFEVLGAAHDAITWLKNRFASLPTWTQKFLTNEAKPEVTILEGLMPVAVSDVVAGGFSTASFVKAGKDVFAKLVEQNVQSYTIQSVMANLNMAVSTDPAAQDALAKLTALATGAGSGASGS